MTKLFFFCSEEIENIITDYLNKDKPLIYEDGCLCYNITGVQHDSYGCYLRGFLFDPKNITTVAVLTDYPNYDKTYNFSASK